MKSNYKYALVTLVCVHAGGNCSISLSLPTSLSLPLLKSMEKIASVRINNIKKVVKNLYAFKI